MFLSVYELRVVRAALLATIEGNPSEWESLSDTDREIACDLLDALPMFATAAVIDDDDDGEEEDSYEGD